MTIVAFSGFKFSGKDTSANYLAEKYGFKRISFADPLKDMVAMFFNVPRSYLDDSNHKESPLLDKPVPTTDGFTSMISEFMVREFRTAKNFPPDVSNIRSHEGVLQTFTNDWENLYHTPRSLAILVGSSMRAADPAFWVKQAVKVIKVLQEVYGVRNFAISDLRYQSEINQLREVFGIELVTIRINRFDSSPSSDPSERDLDNYLHDFNVRNTGTLEELRGKIDEIVNVWV